ncbi:hypothetical protein [Crenobacter caeni]|uniref:hypothetical protein n=1 Tax=Crenobacter caeni TaxID=2705474 RepID=UPI0013D26CDD|nr:hypothetical protein [Crenobacter caeni]
MVFQSAHISDPVGAWICGNSGAGGMPTWDVVGAHGSHTGFLPPIKDALVNKNKDRIEVDKMWGIESYSVLKKLD